MRPPRTSRSPRRCWLATATRSIRPRRFFIRAKVACGAFAACAPGQSTGEELPEVFEGFELERVARGVEDEQRRLLAGGALEAGVGLHHPFNLVLLQARGELPPLRAREHHAAVGDRHPMP